MKCKLEVNMIESETPRVVSASIQFGFMRCEGRATPALGVKLLKRGGKGGGTTSMSIPIPRYDLPFSPFVERWEESDNIHSAMSLAPEFTVVVDGSYSVYHGDGCCNGQELNAEATLMVCWDDKEVRAEVDKGQLCRFFFT